MVNGKIHRERIQPFTVGQIFSDSTDLDSYMSAEYAAGAKQTKDGSTFYGFAANAHKIDEVEKIYRHIKLRFLKAAHVMMAYKLPGNNKSQDESYCDDGEHGGGRRLLRLLKDSGQLGVMLAVVRVYNGQHIGPNRFELITKTADDALENLKKGVKQRFKIPHTSLLPLLSKEYRET